VSYIKRKQQGLSSLGIIGILIVAIFTTTLVLKMLPVYLEHFSVVSSLDSLQEDGNLQDVKSSLMRKFSINDVDNVTREHIDIKREGKKKTVTITYEVRKNVVSNIDIVLRFSDSVVLSK